MNINITLVIQGLAFFAVVLLLKKYGWPSIMGAIEERQKKIADGLAAAEAGKGALAKAEAKETEMLKEARTKATEILEKAHSQANQILDKAKEDALGERGRQLAAAEADVQSLAQQAKDSLRHQVAELAVKGAEKLIRKEINPAAHKALLDELIAEI